MYDDTKYKIQLLNQIRNFQDIIDMNNKNFTLNVYNGNGSYTIETTTLHYTTIQYDKIEDIDLSSNTSNILISCDNISKPIFDAIVYFLYITIFLAALIGNGIVCSIVKSMPRMRTVTNYFIANLAVGDILMSMFCIFPSFLSMLVLAYWPFGGIACQLVNYSQAVSVLVSAYTLVAISIDRYIAIMWPLRPRLTKRDAKYIIFIVWLIALLTAFPIAIFSKLTQPSAWHMHCERFVCQEVWPEPELSFYYSIALMALQFLIPVTVMIFTYTRIAIALWGKRPPGEAENLRDQRMAKSKRKMFKMMVIVVIVFTICWLPFNILTICLMNQANDIASWSLVPYIWFAFHWLAMSHSSYNPFIYCYMKDKFRDGFIQVFLRLPGVRNCFFRRTFNGNNGGSGVTGTEELSQLHRINTCTTIIGTRKTAKMFKMMVIVVIVFTICWLPFNILTICLMNQANDIASWSLVPYIWFAFHWLAMSHSSYNPFIYCYMKDKFRDGFIQVFLRLPGVRNCFFRRTFNGNNGGSGVTGTEELSQLHRINTCTTIIGTRKTAKASCTCTETMLLR